MNRRDPDRRVVQIGPIPPPYGGVAVHVRRLAELLGRAGVPVVVYCQRGSDPLPGVDAVQLEDFGWRGWLRSNAPRLGARVIHCHEGWEWSPALLIEVVRGTRVVVTVHSETTMDGLAGFPWYYRVATRLLIRSGRVRWIAVSARIGERLVRWGVTPDDVAVAPAYLPILGERGREPELAAGLSAFVGAHAPVLTVYGWYMSTTLDGADVYGFDLAIQALAQLRETLPECGLVVLLPSGEPGERVAAMQRMIDDLGLAGEVCVWSSPLRDPTPLWLVTDVYLRPTRTDGDAVSVREVLALGGCVVASDCCDRPDGVRVFASGDVGALVAAIREQAGTPDRPRGTSSSTSETLNVIEEAYGLPSGSLGATVRTGEEQ